MSNQVYRAILRHAADKFMTHCGSCMLTFMSEEYGTTFHLAVDVREDALNDKWPDAINELVGEVKMRITDRTFWEELPTLNIGTIFQERIGPLRLTVQYIMPEGGEGTEDIPDYVKATFDCAATVYPDA